MYKKILLWGAMVLALAVPAAAQEYRTNTGTLGADEANVPISAAKIGTVSVELVGNPSGGTLFKFEVSNSRTAWYPVELTPSDGGTAVSQTEAAGAWSGTVAGYQYFRVRIDTYGAGSATAYVSAVGTGGGGASGSGGGSGGTVDQGDGGADAWLVTCPDCSGTGVSHVDDAAFTPATDDVVPAAFVFDDVAPDSVNEGDAGAGRMSANRNQYVTLRDAAGNERGVNVTAANELLVELGAGAASIGTLGANSGVDIGDVTLTAGSASIGILGANSGTDIGDVTINNASGAAAVNIQDGGNSITVDGTVAATQSGAWNVTNISGTVSLPTGAATAAKQPALGTAGSASTDVITVQGIASGVKLPVTVQSAAGAEVVFGTDITHDAGVSATGPQIMGGCDDVSTDPVDEGDAGRIRIDCTTGALKVTDDGGTIETYLSVGSGDNENEFKATAGVLLGMSARNSDATTDAFVKCTNLTAANTTPGSSTIWYEMVVPHLGGVVDRNINAAFTTALTCYIVTGEAASDATDAGANKVRLNVTYK